jgi:hypothetical protein
MTTTTNSPDTFEIIVAALPRRRLSDANAVRLARESLNFALASVLPGVRATAADIALAVGYMFVRSSLPEAIEELHMGADNSNLRSIGEAMTWAESVPSSPLVRFARFWHEGWLALAADCALERRLVSESSPWARQVTEQAERERLATAASFFLLAVEALGEVANGGSEMVVKLIVPGAFETMTIDAVTAWLEDGRKAAE